MKNRVAPIVELRSYLSGLAQRCRAARWFGALFHVTVAEDIVADLAATHAAARAKAEEAEQYDAEGLSLADDVLLNGVVEEHELPKLRRAIAAFRKSRKADADVVEMLRA